MKKVNKEMPAEYDFSGKKGVRGKYSKAFKNGYTVRVFDKDKIVSMQYFAAIEPDLQQYFPDSKSINKALRSLISLIPKQTQKITK
jgi:hypothetical protein